MHIHPGKLQAYFDRELEAMESQEVRVHLDGCPKCQAQLRSLSTRTTGVHQRLSSLAPGPGEEFTAPDPAWRRLTARLPAEKEATMWQKIFARRLRPALLAGSILLILSLALAFPSVRAAAINFLGLFRVQQIEVVQVNPGNLPDQLGSSSSLELLLSENVEMESEGEPQRAASPAEASALSGLEVRTPSFMDEPAIYQVQPGSQVTFQVDLARIRRILAELDRSDIQLPADLDNATVSLEVLPSVMIGYGECDLERMNEETDPDRVRRQANCTTLVQMPSPTITAPPRLDIAQIGIAFLEVMGMDRAEAERFSQTVDWATTLVIPIPRYGVDYEDVRVDGVEGALMTQGEGGPRARYMLLWVKDGIIYALAGEDSGEQALKIANSLNSR